MAADCLAKVRLGSVLLVVLSALHMKLKAVVLLFFMYRDALLVESVNMHASWFHKYDHIWLPIYICRPFTLTFDSFMLFLIE